MVLGVAISLRKDPKSSFYKNMLLGLLNGTDADELLICSGYIQYLRLDKHGNPTTYNVFLDEDANKNNLLDAICRYRKVTIVGIRSDVKNDWYRQYKDAVDYLKSEIAKRGSSTQLKCYYHKSGEWHAKIAILLRNKGNDKIPIAAMVGSSNLTKPPMNDSYTPSSLLPKLGQYTLPIGYNLEADTLIYVNEEAARVVEQQLVAYVDMEYGEVLSFSNIQNIYGNKNINSEGDVILAEYHDVISQLTATQNYTKL